MKEANSGQFKTIHGLSRTKSYKTFQKMHSRCYNPRDKRFKNYGGRGITVCERWKDIKSFIADMGERPDGETIDRIDNNKGYSPDNCRWATPKEQSNNRSSCRILTYKGKSRNVAQWASYLGINPNAMNTRISRGWSIKDIIDDPPKSQSRFITYKGKTQTLTKWAMDLGMDRKTFSNRVYGGWDIDRAITTPVKSNPKCLTYNGKTQTLTDWSRELGVTYQVLNGRLEKGWSVEKTLTTPIRKQKKDPVFGRSKLFELEK